MTISNLRPALPAASIVLGYWAGFVGQVSYDAGGLDVAHRAALDALASLAPFAGCGAYTTSGFGAVDRVERC